MRVSMRTMASRSSERERADRASRSNSAIASSPARSVDLGHRNLLQMYCPASTRRVSPVICRAMSETQEEDGVGHVIRLRDAVQDGLLDGGLST